MSQQRITGLFFLALGLTIWFVTPLQATDATSAFFPKAIGAGLVLLGTFRSIQANTTSDNSAIKRLFQPLLLQYYGIVTAVIIAIQYIGFYPSMLIFLPVCAALFGARNKIKLGLFSVCVTGTFYLILDVLLGSNLP